MNAEYRYENVVLDALQRAVAEALERKRRLGQYAVIWRDGKMMCIGPDAPVMHYPRVDEGATAPGVAEPGKE
jgi:hypothetical protein